MKDVWERKEKKKKKKKKSRPEFDDVPTLKDDTGPLSVTTTSTQFQLSGHSQANTLGIRVELEVLKGGITGECLFISGTSLLYIVSLICSLASEDIKQKERKKERKRMFPNRGRLGIVLLGT